MCIHVPHLLSSAHTHTHRSPLRLTHPPPPPLYIIGTFHPLLSLGLLVCSSAHSVAISDKVREAVTAKCNLPRYKIIVQVTVGQCNDQGIRVASRCLWNTETDNYASTSFVNKTLFCNVIIFALYTD